jgi:hypothetical protein
MKPCKDVVALLVDFLERRLPPSDQVEMEAHFNSCDECQEFLQGYTTTLQLIRNLREDKVDIPEAVRIRLHNFLKNRRPAVSAQ